LLAIQAAFLALVIPGAGAAISINIDLGQQKAFLLQDGQIVYDSPISSGRAGHRTPTGVFAILEKDPNHLSSLYGRIVDDSGDVVVRDADADMVVPAGCKFVAAPMKYFMRFDGATGMHAGILPGYPASHGCVRMPRDKAILFFNIVPIGAEVRVYGNPPEGRSPRTKIHSGVKPLPSPLPSPAPTPKRGFFQSLFGHGGGPPPAASPPPRFYPN
jgi:hypothetical protein